MMEGVTWSAPGSGRVVMRVAIAYTLIRAMAMVEMIL